MHVYTFDHTQKHVGVGREQRSWREGRKGGRERRNPRVDDLVRLYCCDKFHDHKQLEEENVCFTLQFTVLHVKTG